MSKQAADATALVFQRLSDATLPVPWPPFSVVIKLRCTRLLAFVAMLLSSSAIRAATIVGGMNNCFEMTSCIQTTLYFERYGYWVKISDKYQ